MALARAAVLALVIAPLAVLGGATPAGAVAPTVTVTVGGGGNVIAGGNASYDISAKNTGATDGFNLALYVDVPAGVTFVSSTLGTPVAYTNTDFPSIPVGIVRWVWEDVSDLPAGGSFGGSVTVHPTQPAPADNTGTVSTSVTTVFPVGSTFVANARAALSGNPTYLPVFDGATGVGGPTAIAETTIAGPQPVSTSMISLKLSKSEPSPESELLRGVHNQTTVYTLKVTNTSEGDTGNVVLVDHLPAALEFLGCGAVDNSTVDRDATDATINEYNTAARLTGTPLIATNCPTPVKVDTVLADATLATQYGVTAGKVYTQVTWNLGTIPAGATVTVNYAAAIPLHENTLTWDGASTPTPASLGQIANLDNNNGPSTRHGNAATAIDGTTWTNVANVSGAYKGIVRTSTSRVTSARASKTVYAMDLAILKSIDPADKQFVVGNVSNFTLKLRQSEYVNSSQIVVTDELPNGLCPLLPTGLSFTIDSGAVVPAECNATGTVAGAAMISATAHVDGTFTVVFHPTSTTYPDPATFVLAANATHDITYEALDRSAYQTATREYGATTSGDSFGNTVTDTGVTDSITPLLGWFPQTLKVWDDSGASIASDYTTIDKTVMPRSQVQAGLGSGADPCTLGTFSNALETGFRMGDTVCFNLQVTFPSSIDVRNPVITDYLPRGMTYAGYSVISGSVGPIIPTTLDASGGRLEWKVGTLGAGGDLYVSRGSTFTAHVWATIDGPSSGPILDKPQNLMKYRQQNVDGALYFLRDQAAIEIDPEMELLKGVESVTPNGSATPDYLRAATTSANGDGSVFGSNRDGVLVREGEQVQYRVDLTTMPYGATNATVWDVLPTGIHAADVAGITDGGYAADPGGAGYPGGSSYVGATMDPTLNTRSVVVWTGVDVPYDSDPLVMMARKTLNYTVTIPVGTSVATTHDNTASIISYAASINTSALPDSQLYYPTGSYDTANTANTPGTNTRDGSSVYLPSATIAKTFTTEFNVPAAFNNDTQVVKGEIAHFTYTVTVPAHTSVKSGALSDAFAAPANWAVDAAFTQVVFPGGSTAAGYSGVFTVGTTPGFSIAGATGALAFPALYTNDTASDQTFSVLLGAHVIGTSVLTDNPTTVPQVDTARFTSTTQGAITATANVYVRTPNPTITKTVAPTTATAGQTVTYRLRAQNSASRPTAFDAVVTDCVPATLTFGAVQTTPTPVGSFLTSTTDPGCTGTLITWTVGSLVAAADASLYFTATIDPSAAGAASYANTANLSAYSLDDPTTDRALQTSTSTATLTMPSATLVKGVDVATATIGQQRTFTITTTIPANVNFYDAAIIDTVPVTISIPAASDFTNVTMTCTYSDATSCVADLPGWGTTLPSSGTAHGWWLGDILSKPLVRTVTLTYSGTVLDVAGNTTGATITNTAALRWGTSNLLTGPPTNPTNATYNPVAHTGNSTVILHVTQPSAAIVKKVNALDSDTVAPGETFTYTVTVTNPAGTYASPAYNVSVNDVVPTNVLVDPASLVASGGVLTGADPATGGGTITWSLPTLGVGPANAVTFTYTAKLAASGYLNSSSRTNIATAATWASHPLATTPGFTDGVRRTYPVAPAPAPWADAVVTPEFPNPVITKTPSAGPAYIGESKTFTIVVTNSGTSNALNGQVVDTLPGNWIYDSGSTTINGVAAANPTISGQTLTWSGLPTLAPTTHVTIVYTAHPDATVTWTGANTGEAVNYTNNATVTVDDVSGAHGNLTGPYTSSTSAIVHIDKADLSIDKAHNPALDPTAGSSFSWTLTVTNSNTSDTAVGPFVVVDTLPADATYVGFTGTGWAADTSVPGQVTFTHGGTLAANGALPIITVNVTIPANVVKATDFTNTATVASKTFDPDVTNNHDSDPAATVIVADVELVKTSVGGPFTAGQTITWNLVATNHGPSVAVAPFVVTDTLPATVDWSSVATAGTGWSCAAVTSGGVLVCTWSTSTLVVGGSTDALTVSATVLPSTVGNVDNTATVAHSTPDPNLVNNTDATSDTVLVRADVELVKTAVGAPFTAGETIAWNIDLTNHGPSVAVAPFTVTDTLPASVDWTSVAVSGTGWTCDAVTSGGSLVCHWSTATLAVGGSAPTLSISATILPATLGNVSNTATVTHPSPDPVPANNTDGTIDAVATSADLQLTKTSTGGPFTAGDTITWDVVVANNGPSVSPVPVVVTDTLPANLDWTTVAASGTGWTCDPVTIAGDLVCSWSSSTIAVGDSAPTLTVSATILPGDIAAVDNTATVAGPTHDPNPDNNTDATSDTPLISADVELVKTSSGGPFTAGDAITWHLDVTNHGPSVAVAPFTVTDTLPATVDWGSVTASGTGWSCDPVSGGGSLVCAWSTATLAVGESIPTLTVRATVLASIVGDVINTATVVHPTPDPNVPNNTGGSTDTLRTSADLSLNKTTVSVDIPANGTGRFRFEVANAGPSDALNVVVHDTLPGGLTFDGALANLTSAPGDTWSCVAGGGDVTLPLCTLTSNGGTLPLGGSTWFEFDVQADATVTAAVLNTATVSSDTPDPNLSNNTDDSTTKPVLTIHKSSSPGIVARGSKVTYTINVESLSYGATNDVTVTDAIPVALHVDSISVALSGDPSVPGWTDPCVLSGEDVDGYGGTVTCVLNGTLERGRTTPNITIIATVNPSTPPGTLLNVAEVRWTDPQDLVAGVFSEDDSAPVGITLTDRELAATGAMGLPYELAAMAVALILGIGMVAFARRRDGSQED
jgi:uncharacterized repeat protein (TIGR01451 family)/fimbrial isopeptide formation D2 family protein